MNAPRCISIKPVRDGFMASLSNTPVPRVFKSKKFADVLFDLELEGYDVTRPARREREREQRRHTRR